MKQNKKIRISALLMAMLLVSMAFVPVISAQTAQDVGTTTSIDCPCSQGVSITDDSDAKVETTELSGVKQNEAMAQALSDKGVLKLREELIKSGYEPSIEKNSAMKAAMTNESGTITSTIVAMPFSGKNENETAIITFVSNELGSAAAAVVISDGMLRTLGYDSISGDVQILGITCDFCLWAVDGICESVVAAGCWKGCGALCTKVPNPAWAAICFGTCMIICEFVIDHEEACDWTAKKVCEEAGVC